MTRKIGSRYEALEVLGRGTSGTVWRGNGPEGPVAIKLLREDLAADSELITRFVQERTAFTSLDHPNIVRVRDLVVDGEALALVMDLVDGSDLRDRLDVERVLVPETAVQIVADVAAGLAAAHAVGVVHRDVKPENILLDQSSGRCLARLGDFGIARLVDSPRRTRATRIIGTPDYLAPEVIEGLPPSPAVDVYALATVLYELLSGCTPFGGGHPGAVLRRHVTDAVPGIPGLPPALAEVLSSCLTKAPAARLKARELAARLRALAPQLAGLPSLVADPGEWRGDGSQTLPASRAAAAGVVPLVAAVLAGGRPEPERDLSRETHTNLRRPVLANTQYEPAPAAPVEAAPAVAGTVGAGGRGSRSRRTRWLVAGVALALVAGAGAVALQRPQLLNAEFPWLLAKKASDVTPTTAGSSPLLADPPSPWSAWRASAAAPVRLAGEPDVGPVGARGSLVVARGADGQVWWALHTAGRLAGWQRLEGLATQYDPAVVSVGENRAEVFAVNSEDQRIHRRVWNRGRWTGWTRLDTDLLAGGPIAVAARGRQVHLAIPTSDGGLVVASSEGGLWRTSDVVGPGVLGSGPAVAAAGVGALEVVFARLTDRRVLRVSFRAGRWGAPQDVGFSTAAEPDVLVDGEALRIFARTENGQLAERVLRAGRWTQSQVGLGSAVVGGPAAVAAGDGRVAVFTRTANGRLQYTTGP